MKIYNPSSPQSTHPLEKGGNIYLLPLVKGGWEGFTKGFFDPSQ